MLGYNYKDIQVMGGALQTAIDTASPDIKQGLLQIWDFFEGLLAEGYIEGEEVEV
jgi:hypothetical protein